MEYWYSGFNGWKENGVCLFSERRGWISWYDIMCLPLMNQGFGVETGSWCTLQNNKENRRRELKVDWRWSRLDQEWSVSLFDIVQSTEIKYGLLNILQCYEAECVYVIVLVFNKSDMMEFFGFLWIKATGFYVIQLVWLFRVNNCCFFICVTVYVRLLWDKNLMEYKWVAKISRCCPVQFF